MATAKAEGHRMEGKNLHWEVCNGRIIRLLHSLAVEELEREPSFVSKSGEGKLADT